MKATELMIGDWVKVADNEFRLGFTAKVAEVYKEAIFTESGENEGECIEEWNVTPIQLTPEILEKNGFKPEKGQYSRWYHAQMERMIITLYRSDTFYSIMINTDVYLPVLNNIQLHSVHELQHCLKMVGIDKEIIL